MVGDGMVMDN